MSNKVREAYALGFMRKCAEMGVDPEALVKASATKQAVNFAAGARAMGQGARALAGSRALAPVVSRVAPAVQRGVGAAKNLGGQFMGALTGRTAGQATDALAAARPGIQAAQDKADKIMLMMKRMKNPNPKGIMAQGNARAQAALAKAKEPLRGLQQTADDAIFNRNLARVGVGGSSLAGLGLIANGAE